MQHSPNRVEVNQIRSTAVVWASFLFCSAFQFAHGLKLRSEFLRGLPEKFPEGGAP